MLLAFDIGNSSTAIGCFSERELKTVIRLQTVAQRTVDEYAAVILPALERRLGALPEISSAIVSSVVPPALPEVISLLQRDFGVTPITVDARTDTGLPIRVKAPASVGADRIVNAVATKELYGAPAIIIDFGTATSFDVLSAAGEYVGGVIAPGLQISVDALVGKTAKLPRIDVRKPEAVIGVDTESAMQSGVVLGYECLVEGLIRKIQEVSPEIRTVVATGGYGKLFSEESALITQYDAELTLRGLDIIAGREQG